MNTKSNLLKSIFISLILLVGATNAWAYNYGGSNIYYYFANTGSWPGVHLYIWNGTWNTDFTLTQIANTKVYYHKWTSAYNGNEGILFRGAADWNNGQTSDIKANYTSHTSWIHNNTTGKTDLSNINRQAKVVAMLSTGGDYTATANANYTATVSGYTVEKGNSTATSKSASTSGSANNASISAAYGSTITYTATAGTGYTFKGFSKTNSKTLPSSPSASGTTATASAYGSSNNSTYYAYFVRNEYSITYELNGGSGTMAPTTYNIETATFSLPEPTRNGYKFDGWYENSNLTGTAVTQIATGTTGNKTFYAKWIQNATYSLLVEAGTGIQSVTGSEDPVTLGSSYSITATPKTGYTFSTWTAEPAANATFGSATTANTTVTVKNGSVTVTASATENTHDITILYKCEGSSIKDETTESAVGEVNATNIEAPTINGYEFSSWTLGSGVQSENTTANPISITTKASGEYSLTANYNKTTVTVYAINSASWEVVYCHNWKEGGSGTNWPGTAMDKTGEKVNGFDVYTISFSINHDKCIFNNNDKGKQTGDLTVQDGKYYDIKTNKWYDSLNDVPAPNPLASDVFLAGSMNSWNTIANEFILTAENSKTAVLTIELEASTTYEFKVVANGDWKSKTGLEIKQDVSEIELYTNNENSKITTTIAGAYTFTWNTDNSKLSVTYPTPTQYTITYHTNGGNEISQGTYNETTATFNLPTPTKTGYTFAGWYTTSDFSGNTVTQITKGTTGDKEFWAKWTINSHTVTWKPNGGNWSGNSTNIKNTYTYGANIEQPSAPSRIGYEFNGWKEENAAEIGVEETMPDRDLTYTAQWEANSNTSYVVKHYKQNLDGSYPQEATETETFTGTTDTKVTPAVKSYEGFTAPATQTCTIAATGNLIVTYEYTRNSYQLTWELAGGTITKEGTAAGQVKFETSLTAPTVEKTGYTFASWNTEVASTMPAAVTTYTAKWTANKYTVTFDSNGATEGSTSDQDFTYDQAQNLNANGFRYGSNVFLGWSKEAKGTVEYTDQQSVNNLTTENNGKVVLYAIWATPKTIYLKTVEGEQDGAKWFVKYGNTEVEMTELGCTDEFYTAEVPEQTEFQFVSKDNAGNVVQTKGNNLVIPNDDKNLFNLVAAGASGDKIFFEPNQQWVDEASTKNYYFAGSFWTGSSVWKQMTDDNGDGIYECEKPTNGNEVIFCLVETTDNIDNWGNDWSHRKIQTDGDNAYKQIPNGSNLFTITDDKVDQATGTWSEFADTPVNGEGEWTTFTGITYRITFNQQEATTAGTTHVDVAYHASMPEIEKLPTKTEKKFGGYYTQEDGQGIMLVNAFGEWQDANGYVSSTTWEREDCITLYAYWKNLEPEITDITLSADIFEPVDENEKVFVTADPIINEHNNTTLTYVVCWKLLYTNGREVEGEQYQAKLVEGNKVQFSIAGLATGTYTIRASLHTGNPCGSGDEISRFDKQFSIVANRIITVNYTCDGNTIMASTKQNAHVINETKITAPNIVGYTFKEWVAGDGVIISTADKTSKEIYFTAYYDGNLTATYTKNENIIYFYNTLGWQNVYVYFYSGFKIDGNEVGYWNNEKGTGSQPKTNNNDWYGGSYKGYAQMEQIAGTDIWYVNASGKSTTYLVFGKDEQPNYDFFFATEVVRRNDYNKTLPMYVPIKAAPEYKNQKNSDKTTYYNKGYWMNYPENTGYKLQIYDGTGDGAKEVASVRFPYSTNTIMPLTVSVDLEAGKTYGFKILREDNTYFSNSGTMTANSNGWSFTYGIDQNCGLKTTLAGDYTFTLKYTTPDKNDPNKYEYCVDVVYPVSVGDYRVVYTDNAQWSQTAAHGAKWYHPSYAIKKNSSATEEKTDIVSFFIAKNNSPAMKFQKCTAINGQTVTWADVENGAITPPKDKTETSVYNFIVKQPAEGNSIRVESVEPYTGNYYIRVDAMDGKWGNYKTNPNNRMTYSAFSEDENKNKFGELFSHYATKWCEEGTNVKFTIANDYSPCISDTLIQDNGNPFNNIDIHGKLTSNSGKHAANIRFMWNRKTNKISRAYVAGSTFTDRQFLILKANKEIKNSSGGSLSNAGDNHNEHQAIFSDTQNWIYERTIQVQPGTRVKLYACYPEVNVANAQYFRGTYDNNNATWNDDNSVQILGGTDASWNTIRIIYDFKTNRLMAAWVPTGEINNVKSLEADMMILREHQEDAACITFADSEDKLVNIKTVYGVLRLNKYILNNKKTTGNHEILAPKDQKSIYERALYFISFPFDVHLSDVFGFGTYGTHWVISEYNGERRAENGYFVDNCVNEDCTNWDYIWDPSNFTLEANKGYLLSLDLDLIKSDNSDFWRHNINTVELYFPSYEHIETIQQKDYVMQNLDASKYLCKHKGHEVIDSYWRCIGVPSFANYDEPLSDGTNEIQWQPKGEDFPFLYEWNVSDNSLMVQSTNNYTFRPTFAYLVQNGGEIHWSIVNKPEPANIVARKEAPSNNYEWKITLTRNEQVEDQAFIRLSNDEKITNNFDFNQDLSKEFNYGRSDIYTLIGYEKAAANSLPISEQTTVIPLGLSIEYNGDYTLAMPDRVNGIGVTLVDNQTGTRTNLSAGMDYTLTLNKGDYNNRFFIEISPVQQTPTDIEYVTGDSNSQDNVRKVLIDNILYIVRDGQIFDARGARVK